MIGSPEPRRAVMSGTDATAMAELIADLLMGAAYADHTFDGRERAVVREMLEAWLAVEDLPAALVTRLDGFDPDAFSLDGTVEGLGITDPKQARKVLELVAAVNEADEEIDLDEDEYLKRLAVALGVGSEESADLALEILSVEELRADFEELSMHMPPPLPK
jgi:tellurite resistance protein